ncbi:branched-chain amino acid transport system II carrier protein [Parvimonas micra]|jgi:branched-chain amino acid transport system II carrier protein|uniref:branched-chain amino acid transport system II carrier protein n=1 Tax=Parvimonas micra TaxID=33033 RepID=UPI001CB266A3|nr:branched-chain amino acid transport system II carrier protein [Parvimonas micra]MBF1053776.1 branched-chain amino acid transport system II carrier protein [Parvimonas sp.]MCE3020078.1 branched-chain amino acid transport system II carrier protein [Parvimonas micra]
MKNNLTKEQFFSVAIMLFGLFFGAGNLIFPPLLGKQAGGATFQSLLAFGITAVVFPILGVVAVAKTKGLSNLASKVDKYFAIVFTTMIYMAIGPGLGIPRAGSLPFEMAVAPFLPENVSLSLSRLVYTFVFFLVAYLVCLKPNKLVTRMGKFLTPALLVLITVMFVGVLFKNPNAVTSPVGDYATSSTVKGFLEGYNTMDTIAALNFGLVISLAVKSFKVEDEEKVIGYTVRVGLVAGSFLFVIYAMLAYIGMTTSGLTGDVKNGAEILTTVSQYVFGKFGIVLLASIFTLACLTTCIGLITSISKFFETMTKEKVSYHKWIVFWTFLSFLVANFGLNTILKVSVPVLVAIYPVSIVLILLGLTEKYFGYNKFTYRLVCYTVTFISVVEALLSVKLNIPFVTELVSSLPFFSLSLGWVLPMVLTWLVGMASKLVEGKVSAGSAAFDE